MLIVASGYHVGQHRSTDKKVDSSSWPCQFLGGLEVSMGKNSPMAPLLLQDICYHLVVLE